MTWSKVSWRFCCDLFSSQHAGTEPASSNKKNYKIGTKVTPNVALVKQMSSSEMLLTSVCFDPGWVEVCVMWEMTGISLRPLSRLQRSVTSQARRFRKHDNKTWFIQHFIVIVTFKLKFQEIETHPWLLNENVLIFLSPHWSPAGSRWHDELDITRNKNFYEDYS